MAQSNIVFLIDVNGIPRDPAILDAKRKANQQADTSSSLIKVGGGEESFQNECMDLVPFSDREPSQDIYPTSYASPDNLAWLKEFVLLTLFKEANRNGKDYDFSRVQWSFKFFDSSHHVDYRDGRVFMPFDNDSFNNFETQLSQRMKPVSSSAPHADAYSSYDGSRLKYLSDAIKIITGSLPWSEDSDLNFSKSFNNTLTEDETISKNTVFTFLRVPRTEKQLRDFSDLQSNSSTKDFMGVLLPSAFSHTFHHKLRIQLNFVDMWAAPENKDHSYVPEWSGSYPRQIVKCLQYLGNGKILPVPFQAYSALCSASMSLGLIPYTAFLRSCLQQASTQNENVPSHIQKLAPVTSKTGIVNKNNSSHKISPEFDSDSLSRSLRSGGGPSLLEASFNIHHHHHPQQSKVVRPYRNSLGFDEDSDHLEIFRQKMAHQERLRENVGGGADRKRKRYQYDSADDYPDYIKPHRDHHHQYHHQRRYSGLDDMESDSVEVDSQCDREQRLENWVNDGVFTVKRKKHLPEAHHHHQPPTKTVPMSRPALSKSFHVFHEPAPKVGGSGSRVKKMLATVERIKYKASTAAEHRRRSSGGGVEAFNVDMKRITEKQEKELSAIKRRLKTFLEGELETEEGDPLSWLKEFKKRLREFANMILQEVEPCLVALAQALVNCASVRFTQQRMAQIREIYRKPNITPKELLEQLLLVDFTSLNLRIIEAHKGRSSRDKKSPSSSANEKKTHRETELQIILRLEIAWCFFIEPDEDAMEDLLQEIVSVLQIIQAYRTDAPIERFVNNVLLPTYSQSSKFMRNLYKKLNIPLPTQLAMDGSPVPNSSRRDDDSSMISSTSSANLYPEDSASQLHLHKRHHHHHEQRRRPSPVVAKRSVALPVNPMRKGNSGGGKKIKRQIMVASSNPKLSVSQQFMLMEKSDFQKKGGGANTKVSPKRVRRNLFDVQKKDKKDSKILMNLTSSSSRITKSPAFKSPKGKSSLSPSGFFRIARSRRQLVMSGGPSCSSQPQFGSPTTNNEILCPESPATPGGALSVTSRYAPTSTSGGSVERPRIVQESPEVTKNDYDSRPIGRVASLSFYSTGNNTAKSRAWEKSETQLMAARIKESVDLRSKELTLSDFEMLPESPVTKRLPPPPPANNTNRLSSPNTDTPRTNLSFCDDSYTERNVEASSPLPSTSDDVGSSSGHLYQHFIGPAPDLDNPNIQALITSSSLFPLCKGDVPLQVTQTEPGVGRDNGSPSFPTTAAPTSTSSPINTNLQTPSKRVQFNLNENLVNTPSSARRSSTGTPKSILKETHDTTKK